MKHKTIAIAVACLVIAGQLAGCGQGAQQPESAPTDSVQEPEIVAQPIPDEIYLAYHSGDSLNPFKITGSLNRSLLPLLYDSLTRPGVNYEPENQLARSVTVSDGRCVVSLRNDAMFSDGVRMTGRDVIYSLTTARDSSVLWRNTLQNVAGCSLLDNGDVEIRLYHNDRDFASLLSFPIVRDGTADSEYPIGVSKFLIAGTWSDGIRLEYNQLYYEPCGAVSKVRLVAVADPDEMNFELRTGDIDMAYTDLSTAEFSNMTGSNIPVALNDMLYLGINGNRGLLAEEKFRQALSLAVNRNELLSNVFVGHARVSQYPFHPDFYRLESLPSGAPRNLTQAQQLIAELELTYDDSDNLIYRGEPLQLRLLVNTENSSRVAAASLIASQLRQLGIEIQVVSDSFSQYQTDIANYQYDLYIGEVRLMDNMDISALLTGSISYATPKNEEINQAYDSYRSNGNAELFCEVFEAQTPFIPLLFRDGAMMFDRDFGAEMIVTEHDLFYNIFDWYDTAADADSGNSPA